MASNPGAAPPSPPSEHELPQAQPPMALFGAMVAQLGGNLFIDLIFSHLYTTPLGRGTGGFAVESYRMALHTALSFACLVAAMAGTLELWRGARGRVRFGALLMFGALAIDFAARLAVEYLGLGAPGMERVAATFESELRLVHPTAWLAVGAGVLIYGWRQPGVRRLVLPLLATSLLAHPYPLYATQLHSLLGDDASGAFAVRSLFAACHVVVFLLALRRGAPLAGSDGSWERAARSLDRARTALSARLWIAAASIAIALVSYGSAAASFDALAELWIFGVPLATLLTQLALVRGVLGAAGLAQLGAPRSQLHGSAATLAAVIALSSLQLLTRFQHWYGGSREVAALPMFLPLVALLAMVLLIRGLRDLLAMPGPPQVALSGIHSVPVLVIALLLQIALQELAIASETRTAVLGASIGAAGVSIFALYQLARMCRLAAEKLRAREPLPAATLLSK